MIASYRRPTPARPAQASADASPSLRWQPAVDTVHPSCFRQNESSCMPSAARASAQIVGSLSRFIRHHVDISVLVIPPVLHDRQIDRTELHRLSLKVRPIPAVAAVINLCCGVTNRKLAHSVWLRFSPRPKVPRRQHVDGELRRWPVPPAASPLR